MIAPSRAGRLLAAALAVLVSLPGAAATAQPARSAWPEAPSDPNIERPLPPASPRPAPVTAEGCAAWASDAARIAAFDAATEARWTYLRAWTDYAQALGAWRKQRLVELRAWPAGEANVRQAELQFHPRLLQLDQEAKAGIGRMKSRLEALGYSDGRKPVRLACAELTAALQELDRLLDLLGRAEAVSDELYSAEVARAGVTLD